MHMLITQQLSASAAVLAVGGTKQRLLTATRHHPAPPHAQLWQCCQQRTVHHAEWQLAVRFTCMMVGS
jgi:hypothetical protein